MRKGQEGGKESFEVWFRREEDAVACGRKLNKRATKQTSREIGGLGDWGGMALKGFHLAPAGIRDEE